MALSWLVAGSLVYYAWWNPAYVSLIIISMLFNFSVGVQLASGNADKRRLLDSGVVMNLALLGYYKYANFFVDTLNAVTDSTYQIGDILLPLGISFFTFQDIAYLVDSYQKKREYDFLNYSLFVTFFPQLIAGPIVHHREMLTQFAREETFKYRHSNMEVGIAVFCIGLFKKVLIADNVAIYSTPLFSAAFDGNAFSMIDAWIGASAYTFQLYFDFSAYSDMAIGIGLMFGIRLPVNFMSPYKSASIIEFWSRWHMTLSRFLRDYLYIPMGGNKVGNLKQFRNLIVTMLLGGLWHGAGWTFVVWGGVHGIYLLINHAWRNLSVHVLSKSIITTRMYKICARLVTFVAVVVAWVLFRAEDMSSASDILSSMFGLTNNQFVGAFVFDGVENKAVIVLLLLLFITWFLPNTSELINYKNDDKDMYTAKSGWLMEYMKFRPDRKWAFATAAMFVISVLNLTKVSEFIYFNF